MNRLSAAKRLLVQVRQHEAVAELALHALSRTELPTLLDKAVSVAASLLEAEFSAVLELLPDNAHFLLRAGRGWPEPLIGQATVEAAAEFEPGYALRSRKAVIIEDLGLEARFRKPDLFQEQGVVSGLSVRIEGNGALYGVLSVHSAFRRTYTEDEASFLERLAGILGQALRREREEEPLRETQERTRLIVETALDAVVVIEANGHVVDWNSQAERIFGWSRDEMIGRLLSTTIIPPKYREAHERGLRHFLETGEGPLLNRRFEITALRRDGHEFPVELTVSPAKRGNTFTFVAFLRDTTEQKLAERRLHLQHTTTRVLAEVQTFDQATEEFLRTICETLGWDLGIVWLVDRHAAVLRYSASWGREQAELKTFQDACRPLTFTAGIGLPGRVWAAKSPAWIPDVQEDTNFPRKTLARQAGLHGALGFPILLGGEVLGVQEFFSTMTQEPDTALLTMMGAIGYQIGQFTERKQLEEQLRQGQKMEAVGRLAGGIAHDFNNLLTVIEGYSDLVLATLSPQDPLRPDIEEIRKASKRASVLTRGLLAFSRRQVLQPKVLDLNAKIVESVQMLRHLIGEHIDLITTLTPELGFVKVDPNQLEQVILNLTLNGRDAMPRGGRLIIETANVELKTPLPQVQITLPPGSYVALTVRDTGIGMDPETQTHIFEPFFTTKSPGKGTGLGLATVYGIVKQSDGFITVASWPGQGTAFTIYFPQVTEAPEAATPVTARVKAPSGWETILLVEDEEIVRSLARTILRSQGYDVLEALDVSDAERLCHLHPRPIHLLLTDVVMPGMSGPGLADLLTGIAPDLRVLFMSGYSDEAIAHHGVLEPGTFFLEKPFTPESLGRKVREALDAPRQEAGSPGTP